MQNRFERVFSESFLRICFQFIMWSGINSQQQLFMNSPLRKASLQNRQRNIFVNSRSWLSREMEWSWRPWADARHMLIFSFANLGVLKYLLLASYFLGTLNDTSNMKFESASHLPTAPRPPELSPRLPSAVSACQSTRAYEARHIVQFIMGIALDLFTVSLLCPKSELLQREMRTN